jgi:hypothetical protein
MIIKKLINNYTVIEIITLDDLIIISLYHKNIINLVIHFIKNEVNEYILSNTFGYSTFINFQDLISLLEMNDVVFTKEKTTYLSKSLLLQLL